MLKGASLTSLQDGWGGNCHFKTREVVSLDTPSFCTKSVRPEKSHFVSDSLKESWLVCKPVASPTCVAGNGGV